MLKHRHQSGFTIIEMMLAITVAAVLLSVGAVNFATWMQNMQIRSAAESIQNGLSIARTQAVQRNMPVSFQLVSSLDNSCALVGTGSAVQSTNWVISLDAAAGKCAAAAVEDVTGVAEPRILRKRAGGDGSGNATVTVTGSSSITFNGLGRLTSAATTIDVANPTGGACSAAAGPMRCLRVVVSAGGEVRMCDPRFTAALDPQGC
jgi:type IV fimbrial biogenesis protein FimT